MRLHSKNGRVSNIIRQAGEPEAHRGPTEGDRREFIRRGNKKGDGSGNLCAKKASLVRERLPSGERAEHSQPSRYVSVVHCELIAGDWAPLITRYKLLAGALPKSYFQFRNDKTGEITIQK